MGPDHQGDAPYLDACRKKETSWNTIMWVALPEMKRQNLRPDQRPMFWSCDKRFQIG
jgi:hypothetical protein